MDTGKKLSKDAKPGEMTLRGTISKPDLTGNLPLGHYFIGRGGDPRCRALTGPEEDRSFCMRPASEH
jgi:hypothetical protein